MNNLLDYSPEDGINLDGTNIKSSKSGLLAANSNPDLTIKLFMQRRPI